MRIEVTQCSMCKHYSEEQYCEIWQQYITNDAFYCACGVTADRKTENSSEKPNNSTISKMEQVEDEPQTEEPPMDEYYKDHDEFYEPQERSSE